MIFSHPGMLFLVVIAVAACAFSWHRRAGLYPPMLFPLWASGETRRRRHTWRRTLTHLVRTALLVVLGILAAGPGSYPEAASHSPRETVVAVLDVSSTMTATDFPGGRLGAVKEALGKFVGMLRDSDVGLVTFAGTAEVRVPPTAARAHLVSELETVRAAAFGEDGTAIGSALANALERLRNAPAGLKRIVLLTDGINNRGSVSAADAARLAAQFGVRIDVIGLGGDEPTRFRAPVSEEASEELEARLEIDERALREISGVTGGKYVRARDRKSLDASLLSLASGSLRGPGEPDTAPWNWLLVLQVAAVVLLVAELAGGALLTPESPV